jgi:hypothetical protein
MPSMARSILIGTAAGLPLAVAVTILVNSVDLGQGLVVALAFAAVGIGALVGAHFEYQRRQPPRARAGHH